MRSDFEKVIVMKPRFQKGYFTCEKNDGLRVEVCGTNEEQVILKIGDEDQKQIYVDKNSADMLAAFFIHVGNVLETDNE